MDDEQYEAKIQGNTKEFELYDSNNFIGLLPPADFVIDLEIDRAVPKVTSTIQNNFNTLSSTEISGYVEMGFSSELLRDLEWHFETVSYPISIFLYEINIDDEWVRVVLIARKAFVD